MTKAATPKSPTNLQTITLKVYIHCEGCRRKVRRIIRVLDDVEDVTVDSASGKVTITGTADVKTILQRLHKYGKQAEVWPSSNLTPAPAPVKAGANQSKPNGNSAHNSNSKKKGSGGTEGEAKATAPPAKKESKKGDGMEMKSGAAAKGGLETLANANKPEKSKEADAQEPDNAKAPVQNGSGGGGGGGAGAGKKGGKKGGNGSDTNSNGDSNNNCGGGTGIGSEAMPLGLPGHDNPIINAPNNNAVVSANKSLAPYDSIQTGYAYHSAEDATHMFSDENANNCTIM